MLVCVYFAHADMLVLKNGHSLECTLLFENELVIVVKDVKGTRYQYPKADVRSFRSSDEEHAIGDENAKKPETNLRAAALMTDDGAPMRKVSLGVELRGGGVTGGTEMWGGAFGVDVLVGCRKIGEKEILLGGMVGYELRALDGYQAHYLPIQLAVRVPILDTKHAPYLGMNIGYGVGLNHIAGGLHAGASVGYRYRVSDRTSLLVGADVTLQQTSFPIHESIGDKAYDAKARNLVSLGAKMGLTF